MKLMPSRVGMTSEIIAELRAPGSNQEAALLISCSIGDIDAVKRISKEYEAEKKALPLHRMITIAMENSQATITQFCLCKGAIVGDSETRYAAWLGRSAELFELLFPHNIFRLDQEPQYIHQLLKDSVTREKVLPKTGRPFRKVRVPPDTETLVKFLVGQGAEIDADTISRAADHVSLDTLRFLLAQFHGSLTEYVLKDILHGYSAIHCYAVRESPSWLDGPALWSPDQYEHFSLLVDRIPPGQISSSTVGDAIFDGPQFVDLLLSRGATLAGSSALHLAAIYGRATMIPYLIDHGLSVNEILDHTIDQEDRHHNPTRQWYPLHYAIGNGKPEAVRVLLEHGADPWLINSIGQTAFEVLAQSLMVFKENYRVILGAEASEICKTEAMKASYATRQDQLGQIQRALMEYSRLAKEDPQMQKVRERFEMIMVDFEGTWGL
jgi:hypothetical protein